MFKLVALLALLLTVATSAAAQDDEPVLDEWTLKCFSDTPEPKDCGIYWITMLMRRQDSTMVGAALGPSKAGQIFGILAQDGLCDAPGSTMQIDAYFPEPLRPNDEDINIPDIPADETIARLDAGTMLFLRLHLQPDCALAELAIPLPGFSEAWARMPR